MILEKALCLKKFSESCGGRSLSVSDNLDGFGGVDLSFYCSVGFFDVFNFDDSHWCWERAMGPF